MKLVVSTLLVLLVVSLIIPHSLLTTVVDAKSAKDSKARRDIDRAIGRAVEGNFTSIKRVDISTYAAPNASLTVYNKTSGGSLPPIITPPEPQVCNKNDHLENGVCVPDPVVPAAAGFKICMVGDFKDSKVFDAMKTQGCNYKIAIGDNGYSSNLDLLKKIAPDRCVIGNHDATEDGNDKIYKEALAYCGDSWWTKIGNPANTLILGFNTNGDTTKQLNAVKDLFSNSQFIIGIKNVIVLSHKGGHVFPNAHHPAEAKTFYGELEKTIPSGIKLLEVAAHNHNSAASANNGWYIAGNGGKSFYSCGIDQNWTFCNNKVVSYLQASIDSDSEGKITVNFLDTTGKTIF